MLPLTSTMIENLGFAVNPIYDIIELMEFSDVEVFSGKRVGLEETTICPIGDLQYGAQACDLESFQEHVAWCLKQPNPIFIGMGDMVDFGSPSNRGALRALIEQGALYDSAQDVLHNAAEQHLEVVRNALAPTKGKWLGMVEGHHFYTWPNGETSDMRLCDYLGASFLGSCGVVKLQLSSKDRKSSVSVNIWAHHGRGAGQALAAPLNQLEKYMAAWEDIDIFLMAHHHKMIGAKTVKLRPVFSGVRVKSPRLLAREILLAGTGGFLKAYVPGHFSEGRAMGAYPEKGMMKPLPMGAPVISITPEEKDGILVPKIRLIT